MADSLSWLEYHLLTDLNDLKRATLSLLRMCLSRKRSNGEMAISDLNARWSCRRGSILISRLHDLRGRTIHDRFECIDWLLARPAAVRPCGLRELSNSYWRTGYVRSTALVNLSDHFRGWMDEMYRRAPIGPKAGIVVTSTCLSSYRLVIYSTLLHTSKASVSNHLL